MSDGAGRSRPRSGFALVPLAVLTAMKPHLRLSGVTLVVMVLIPGEANWHRPLDRVLEILIGTAASIAVSLILYPRKAKAVVEKAGAEIEAEPETEVDTSVQATRPAQGARRRSARMTILRAGRGSRMIPCGARGSDLVCA